MHPSRNVGLGKPADGQPLARTNARRAHTAEAPRTILPKPSLLLVCAAAASILCAGSSLATDHTNCIAYGDAAAAAAKEVRELACGFDLGNPRWASTDPKPHWDWCDAASDDDVAQEWAVRNSQLSACEAASKTCRTLQAQ